MAILLRCLSVLAFTLLLALPVARAEEPEAKAEVPAGYASDEEAQAALETFKTEYKAKGLKGEERLDARIWAMKALAQTQHKDVADQLAKLMKERDEDIKTAAVQYIGCQRALSGYAGQKVVVAMGKNTNDSVFLISGLQAIQDLGYQGAHEMLRDMMKHKDYAVKKSAMFAIRDLKDMRLLEDVFQLLRKIKKAKGDSWDGVSVNYDTGTAGDHDQKMAEKIGKEKLAKNKGRAGRGGARSQRDIGPVVEEVLKALTGEEFESAKAAQDWINENAEGIIEEQRALNDKAAEQHDVADALK